MNERSDTVALRWFSDWGTSWDRFWFTPRGPHTLAVMRIACGAMLAYLHTVWASVIGDFFGPNAWVTTEVVRAFHRDDWAWSWLWYTESTSILMLHQLLAIAASVMMMLGLFTRLAIPLAWWLTLMVCHRMTGALFGLDQVLTMLSMYLMWSRCGSVLSLDVGLRRRWLAATSEAQPTSGQAGWGNWLFPAATPSIANNVVTRLLQLHLCVIYLFGGLSKMRGEMWFDGSALWYTAVNYEYQSLDLTWLGRWRIVIATLTATTIFWETFYSALVWPRLTRPLTLALAVFVHGGIALALGMVTFGFIMIVANLAFIEPQTMRGWLVRFRLKRTEPSAKNFS